MTKAFAINPYAIRSALEGFYKTAQVFEEAIKEIDIDMSDYRNFYPALSEPGVHEVSTFTAAHIGATNPEAKDDTVYVDDDGIWNNAGGFFLVRGYPQPLAGKGVVLGTTRSGKSCSPRAVTLEWLRRNVIVGYEGFSFSYARPDTYRIHVFGIVREWCNLEAWDREDFFA